MRLNLLAVGRLKAGPEVGLCEDYLTRSRRLGPLKGVRGPDLIEVEAGPNATKEWARLAEKLSTGSISLRFDETGQDWNSEMFAERLQHWLDAGTSEVNLIIGGADGFTAEARQAVPFSLRFGSMTWPHALARVMAAEQIYRALSILTNSPYHRSGSLR
jgi:23S rRNA (pseudouridine1915-N3)-methyltransferase